MQWKGSFVKNYYSLDKRDRIIKIVIGYVRLLECGVKQGFFGISFTDQYSDVLKMELRLQSLILLKTMK